MKTFEKCAAQGDLMLFKVDALPDGLVKAKPEGGKYILAHSETGHHHTVMDRPDVVLHEDPIDPLRAFLDVRASDIKIEHERSFDTHETINPKSPGIYEIRRQREYTPEGYRRAAD